MYEVNIFTKFVSLPVCYSYTARLHRI